MAFFPGTVAEGVHFYGRRKELERVIACDWAWVCAQRRMGKTSLLRKVAAMVEEQGGVALPLDLGPLDDRTIDGPAIADVLLRTNRRRLARLGVDSRRFNHAGSGVFAQLVESLADLGKQVTFLWDEAEKLVPAEKNQPGLLDSLYQQLDGLPDFRFYLAASQTLSGGLALGEGAIGFLKRFRWRPLGGLSDGDAEQLLRCSNTSDWTTPLPPPVVDEAIRWCGGHPFILQHLGERLSEETGWNGKAATLATLDQCRESLVVDPLLRHTLDDDHDKLTPNQQAVLGAICEAARELGGLAQVVRLSTSEVADAVALLATYGYLSWDEAPSLRFGFYRRLIRPSGGAATSQSEQQNVDRMGRTVFISYSHEDDPYRLKLVEALKPYAKHLDIQVWDDREIRAGADWAEEIECALRRSNVAVILISPSFLASDFITGKELPQIIELARSGRCTVLSINVGYTQMPAATQMAENLFTALANMQALNPPDKPLIALSPDEQQRILVHAAAEIIERVSSG